jgi:hypothetical protein
LHGLKKRPIEPQGPQREAEVLNRRDAKDAKKRILNICVYMCESVAKKIVFPTEATEEKKKNCLCDLCALCGRKEILSVFLRGLGE